MTTGPSRLFREFIAKFPNESFTRTLIKDLDYPGTMGHTGYAIYSADLDVAFAHADSHVLPRLEELTGIKKQELYKIWDSPHSAQEAYFKYLHEVWK